jgi:polyisoprenoid-binding protein YceI
VSQQQENTVTRLQTFAPITLALTAALIGCANAPSSDAAMADNRSAVAGASWTVDTAQSSLSFVTVKAGQPGVAALAEVQSFKRFAGDLTPQGQIRFTVDLASVDTGIEIRDERLRTMLFNVKATPQATFSAQIEPAVLRELSATGVRDLDLAGQLVLAGQSQPVVAKVRVAQTKAGAISVATRAPIVVNASDYGLKAGVEALREVMGLNMISAAAPVSFTLVMRQPS